MYMFVFTYTRYYLAERNLDVLQILRALFILNTLLQNIQLQLKSKELFL